MESNIKLCTDLKQSKKLKEILSIESADHHYVRKVRDSWGNPFDGEWSIPKPGNPNSSKANYIVMGFTSYETFPCWSLAVLLEGVLPNKIVVNHLGYEKSCIFSFSDNSWYLSYYNDVTFCTLVAIIKESLLDACYEMILELHKMNLL